MVDNNMRERLAISVVGDDANTAVGEDVPDAMFLAVVDPFGDEGEVNGRGFPVMESGCSIAGASECGNDIVPKLFCSLEDGGWIGIEIYERVFEGSEFLRC